MFWTLQQSEEREIVMEIQNPLLSIPGIDRMDIGSLLFVGSYKYYCLMVKNLQEGICPFCQIDHKINEILYENDSWRAWVNPVLGKKNTALHLVIPCKRHITHVRQLRRDEGADLVDVFNWADIEFELPGGGVTMRFGDPLFNAGTIRHLHCNIQVPDGNGKLEVTLAKDKDKILWHWKVVAIYEKMRLGTPFESLSPEEQELVKDRLG